MKKKYQGIVVPTVTPLTSDLKLDVEAVEMIFINFRKHSASPFILGTTGEAASLPLSIKLEYARTACRLKQTGDTLYAGISSNCLEESIHLAKEFFDTGIDVVVATLPSYYPLSPNQMKTYFEQLADAIPGPLIIYNIPATTHTSIPLSLIDELSHHEKIAGIKDSERSDERLKSSLSLWSARNDFSHFLGWAARSAEALLNGGDGIIPSTGNLYPALYKEMYDAVQNKDRDTAMHLQTQSDLLGDLYQKGRSLGDSLAALKLLMTHTGLCQPYVMPPLQTLTPDEKNNLLSAFEDLKKKEQLTITKPTINA